MCGGTIDEKQDVIIGHGLSPRVRGNPEVKAHVTAEDTVYPRVCGGTNMRSVPAAYVEGLSPRVRGNLRFLACTMKSCRSIPACAGEPQIPLAIRPEDEVYPRVCGGTNTWAPKTGATDGLSPRVRGNLAVPRRHRSRHGSIPACAGEPNGETAVGLPHKVYPRVCGGTS